MKFPPISLFVTFVGCASHRRKLLQLPFNAEQSSALRFNARYVLASPPFDADVVEERALVYESRSSVPDANSNAGGYAARHGGVFPQRYCAPRTRSCFEYDTEYCGSDIGRVEDGSVTTPAACQHICAKTTGCSFWTYLPRASSCHLKSADASHGRTRRESAVSGPRMCPCTDTCYEMDTDYPGSDIRKIEDHLVVSAAECHLLCQIEPLCHFWTWVSAEQNCYLKNEHARRRRVRAPGSISGPCDCPPTDDEYGHSIGKRSPICNEHHFVYSGAKEGASAKVRSSQECQQLCQQRVTCRYFSFLPVENTCMLGSSQGKKLTRPFAISGPKYCPGSFCSEKGLQFYGQVVGQSNEQSFASCLQLCSLTPTCSAVSYNTTARNCLHVKLAEHNATVVSGPKTCPAYDPNTGEPADMNTVTTIDFTGELFCYDTGTEYRSIELSASYADSPESCQRYCRADPRCNFFTYYPYGNSCLTYETEEQRLQSDVAVSGLRECPPSTRACFYHGVEVLGKDVGNCTTEDAVACREVCHRNKLCSVFVYDTVSKICLQRQHLVPAGEALISAPLFCDMPLGALLPSGPNIDDRHPEAPRSPQKPQPDLPEEDVEQPGGNNEKESEFPPGPPVAPEEPPKESDSQDPEGPGGGPEEPPEESDRQDSDGAGGGPTGDEVELPSEPGGGDTERPPQPPDGSYENGPYDGYSPPGEDGPGGEGETEPSPRLPPESDEEEPIEVPPLLPPRRPASDDKEEREPPPMPRTSLPLDVYVTDFESDQAQGDEALPQARSGAKNAEDLSPEPAPSTRMKASKGDAELPEADLKSRHGTSAEVSQPPETGSHEKESVFEFPPLPSTEAQKGHTVFSPQPAPRTRRQAPEWEAELPGFEVQGRPDSPARIFQPPEPGPVEKEPVEFPPPLTFMEAGNGHGQDLLTKVDQRPYAGLAAAASINVIPTPAAEALLNSEEEKSVLTEASLDSPQGVFDDLHAGPAEDDPNEVPLMSNQNTRAEAPKRAAVLTEASLDGRQGTVIEVSARRRAGLTVDAAKKVPPPIRPRPSPRKVEKALRGNAVLLGAVSSNFWDSPAAVDQKPHADSSRDVPKVPRKPPAKIMAKSQRGGIVLPDDPLQSRRDTSPPVARKPHTVRAGDVPREVSVQSSLRKAEGMQKTKEASHEHRGGGGGPPAAQNSQTRASSRVQDTINQFETLTSQGESRSTALKPKTAPTRKHWIP